MGMKNAGSMAPESGVIKSSRRWSAFSLPSVFIVTPVCMDWLTQATIHMIGAQTSPRQGITRQDYATT